MLSYHSEGFVNKAHIDSSSCSLRALGSWATWGTGLKTAYRALWGCCYGEELTLSYHGIEL